jgi:hypothetical protein
MPVAAHFLEIAVDPSRRDDRDATAKFAILARLLDDTAAPDDGAIFFDQILDSTSEYVPQFLAVRVDRKQFDKPFDEAEAGSPEQVIARHAVARHVIAALHPVDGRHEAHAFVAKPAIHALGALLHVGFSPPSRPRIGVRKLRERQPVGEREFGRILYTHAALQRRAYDCHATKSRPGKAADVTFVMPIYKGHRAIVIEALVGGDEARNSCANDDHVAGLAGQYVLLRLFLVGRLYKL